MALSAGRRLLARAWAAPLFAGLVAAGLVLTALGLGSVGGHLPGPVAPEPDCSAATALSVGDTFLCVEERVIGQSAVSQSWMVTPNDTAMAVSYEGESRIHMQVERSTLWNILMMARARERLAPRAYQLAFGVSNAEGPTLSVRGPWASCRGSDAVLHILELVDAPAGSQVVRLSANFAFACPETQKTYRGAIRWHATVGLPVAALTPPPTPRPFASCREAVATSSGTTNQCVEDTTSGAPQPRVELLTPPRSTFAWGREQGFGNAALRFVVNGATSWHMTFAGAAGPPLGVGLYDRARQFPFGEQGLPQMEVTSGSRACSELTGRFAILDLDWDAATGEVRRLAVNFEHHCGGETAGLTGALRYQSAVPLDQSPVGGWQAVAAPPGTPPPTVVARLAVPACAPTGGAGPEYTLLCVVTEAADYTGPRPRVYTPQDGPFGARGPRLQKDDIISIRMQGHSFWTVTFGPPLGQTLGVGFYPVADQFGHATAQQATMSIDLGTSCGPPGQFEVLELEYAPDGDTIRRFAANFAEQACSYDSWTWTGAIRYHATVPP
jgi:hypothetical protein